MSFPEPSSPAYVPASPDESAWDALRRHHRPHAHWYATHVLRIAPGPACDELLDAALVRACRRLGAGRRRAVPIPALETVRDELHEAIRHQAWCLQRRRRAWLRRLLHVPRSPVRRRGFAATLATSPPSS